MPRRRLAVSRKFASAVERVRWAQEDIEELKVLVSHFFSSHPYERVAEIDSKGIYMLDKIKFTRRLPPRITKLTVSAIENLRAALDHGACAVVPRQYMTRTSFPFGDTRREFLDHLESKAKHVPDEIKSVFVRFKAYKRGNPPLWALNKICNTHKHRTIVQPGIDIRKPEFVAGRALDEAIFHYHTPAWDRRKNEIIISRMVGHTTAHHDIDMSLGIAFGDVQVFRGTPVLAVLRYLASKVEGILWATESEARRIGVVK
jgi:hypothetical protein